VSVKSPRETDVELEIEFEGAASDYVRREIVLPLGRGSELERRR
jgi:hypothetical protein